MQKVAVDLGERSYDITISKGLLEDESLLDSVISSDEICVISNETVAPLYMPFLEKAFQKKKFLTIILPDGEEYKNTSTMDTIYEALLKKRFSRKATLVALGGGVIGDMTGFAASTYQRGIHFIQIPTTLLAQVDSSVGGKTGVNHALGKNMIGAFYQPEAVLIDINTISTLPDRELSAGLAEIIKYGLIYDNDFLIWLSDNIDLLLQRDGQALTYAIKKSCECKAHIVSKDERESGIRAILNLGHTFGHAIETATQYKVWLHGEAVGLGMIMALDLSQRHGFISEDDLVFGKTLIERANLPMQMPVEVKESVESFLDLMALDKKVEAGVLRLVLLKSLGEAFVTSEFDSKELHGMLETYLN